MTLPLIDLIGYWVGIFLTFCILSFLYKDNPFYKVAEHIFIGISIGYVVVIQWENVLKKELIDEASKSEGGIELLWVVVIPVALVLMMLCKLSKRFGWLGLYPVAFVVALYAGLQVNNVPNSDLIKQLPTAVQPIEASKLSINSADRKALIALPGFIPAIADKVVARQEAAKKDWLATLGDERPVKEKAAELFGSEGYYRAYQSLDELEAELSGVEKQRIADSRGAIVGLDAQASVEPGQNYWFGIFSKLLLVLGLLASLIYFYFSIEQKGPVKRVARFGVWVLMVGFGAAFGYTVQGRLALAIGRAQDITGENKEAVIADQIHGPTVALISVVIIMTGLFVWELRGRRSDNKQDGAQS